ncbi:hypothetical protein NECAME_06676, partial [Necator americanus]
MFAVCEPHRLTQTLDCMFELMFIIACDEKVGIKRLKMEKDWVEEMEKQRPPYSPLLDYSLQKLSSKHKWKIKENLSTFRYHLFYFFEILIAGIDINDVTKANISIHNLTLLFYIMPLLDYSECVKYHKDLTNDEKSLCFMSARLPLLAELTLDRILQIIQCLAVTSPKDSSTALGSFKDEETRESDEEKVLKKAIDRCVTALFTNTADSITMKLAKKVLTFVKTNQFESQLATDMISSLISQMTYASPRLWLPFAEHVLHNLRDVLTAEAKAAEDLETSAQWFVTLAGSLLSTTSENYIQHKDICFEMIGLLVDCKSKVAYNNGAIGLWYMLYMLSRIYPENSRYISSRLNRPLSEWVPVREWGQLYGLKESKMAWYVPGEEGKGMVKLLLEKFVFPIVESLRDVNMDRLHQLDIAAGEHGDIYNYLTTPLSKKVQIFVLESQAYVAHMRIVVESPARAFTMFHLRVLHLLARLTLNDYSEVRGEARAVLSSLFSEYAIAKESIVEDILPSLTDPNSTRDQLKVVDYPEVIDLYDDLWNDIGKMQKPARKHYECPKLNDFCKKWLDELSKSGQWTSFKDSKVVETTKQMRAARRAANK